MKITVKSHIVPMAAVIVCATLIIVTTIVYFREQSIDGLVEVTVDWAATSTMVLVALGAALASMGYLQRGIRPKDGHNDRGDIHAMRKEIEAYINSRLTQFPQDSHSDPRKLLDFDNIKTLLVREAREEFTEELKVSIRERESHRELKKELRQKFNSMIDRLSAERLDLTRRGNLNLSLGISTAIAGFYLLWNFISSMKTTNGDMGTFFENFAPRISLIVVVEIFAYFFLRLYSSSLMEIKYFQNEITNIEAKSVALDMAVHSGDDESIKEVVFRLARTERNYILQKDQTTVDLEHLRAGKETIASLTSMLENLAKAFSRRP